MKKTNEAVLTKLVAPNEMALAVYTTIHTPPKVSGIWKRYTVEQEEYPKPDRSTERMLVEEWLNQLVRETLGDRLREAEKKLKVQLHLEVPQLQADLLAWALTHITRPDDGHGGKHDKGGESAAAKTSKRS